MVLSVHVTNSKKFDPQNVYLLIGCLFQYWNEIDSNSLVFKPEYFIVAPNSHFERHSSPNFLCLDTEHCVLNFNSNFERRITASFDSDSPVPNSNLQFESHLVCSMSAFYFRTQFETITKILSNSKSNFLTPT